MQETDAAAQMVLEAPAAKESAAEERVAQKLEVRKPADKNSAAKKPLIRKPPAKRSAARKAATIKSVVEEPAVEKPGAKKAAARKPADKETAVQEAGIEEPAAEKSAVEEPAVEEPAIQEPVVEELPVQKRAVKKPTAKKPAAKKSAIKKAAAKNSAVEQAVEEPADDEPMFQEPAVQEPVAEEPAVEEPVEPELAVEKPAAKRPAPRKAAINKSAVEKPVVKEESVEEPDIEGHGELEGKRTTPLAAPGPAVEKKSTVRPSDQLEPREPEVKRSTAWTAINRPPRSPPSVRLPDIAAGEEEATVPSDAPPATKEVPTCKEEVAAPADAPSATPEVPKREEQAATSADAPSATPNSVPKKRKPLPGAVNPIRDIPELRTIGKPKLTRGACTPCRENKLKCLKEKPICSRCSESGTHCAYAFEQPRKYDSASARLALSEAEVITTDRSEAAALTPPASHEDSAVQNLEVKKDVGSSKTETRAATHPLINGHETKDGSNDDAQSSRGTRRSESRGAQLDAESRKRKASEQDKSSTAKKPRHAAAAKKTNLDRKWEAPFVYTDENSPLTNADLRAILLLPQAWDVLTSEERKDILVKFPDDSHILDAGTENARPDLVLLRNNDHFRYDCARYLENIERGRHDEQWLQEAWVAHEKHKRGDYDDFLRKEFENDWATKIPKELLQKISRKSEMPGQDGVVAMSEDTATANGQHKTLPGRAKGASAIQKAFSANPASVGTTKVNGSIQHVTKGTQSTNYVAKHHSSGREVSNINVSQYTQLRFEIPPEA